MTHYALRCDGFDPSTFYAFTVDTHGAMNPRGRDLIRKLARMAADNAVERGAAPRKWWEIADTAITHISVALQRNNARRILAAHNRCQKEALCHRHPAGALGTPTTSLTPSWRRRRNAGSGPVWSGRTGRRHLGRRRHGWPATQLGRPKGLPKTTTTSIDSFAFPT